MPHGKRKVPYTLRCAFFPLWSPHGNHVFDRGDFRTGVIGIHGGHNRDFQFSGDCPPTKALLNPKPQNLIPSKNSFGLTTILPFALAAQTPESVRSRISSPSN
jgi:hypothetical protein